MSCTPAPWICVQFVALCVHEGASGAETEGDGISGVDEKKIFEGINVLTERTSLDSINIF